MSGGTIHIQKSHQGLLHSETHTAKDKKIPLAKEEKVAHSKDPAVRRRAQFAINARHFHHGS